MATNGVKEVRTEELREIQPQSDQSLIDRIIEEASSRMPQNTLIPTKHEWDVYEAMSAMAAGTPFYGKLGGKNGIMAIMLYAREIGMPPMSAINGGIDNIMGRLSISARSVNEKIRLSGHQIRVKSISDTECTIWGKRKDTGEEMESTFTLDDAKRAQLFKKDGGYEKNPQDMMFARAISRLGRRLFPDVIKGATIEGEANDDMEHQEFSHEKQEQKPATIAEMVNKPKDTARSPEVKQPEKPPETKPQPESTPEQEQPVLPENKDNHAATVTESPKGAATQQESKMEADEKRKANGRRIIIDKVSKYCGGDVQKINDTLNQCSEGLTMDNIGALSLEGLSDVNKKLAEIISK